MCPSKIYKERLKYNLKILEELEKLVWKHPELRFCQLLANAKINEFETIVVDSDQIFVIKDNFNEESLTTYEKLVSSKLTNQSK